MDIFALVLVVLVFVIGSMIVKIVPQGYNWTVERFGKFTRVLKPGLHFITPFVEQIGQKVNMMEKVLDVPSQEIITKDNAMVQVDGVAFFQVLDPVLASYQVHNLERAMLNLTQTNIRTVMGSMDLDELLANRDTINHSLLKVVDEATNPWGVKVTRIEIKDINPPRDLVDSMARQMKAEREKRAEVLEAEGKRQAAVLRAEGEKRSAVLKAEGHKEAAFLEAEARERAAEAEARATQMVSQAISEGDVQAVNYFVANNYVDALKELAASPNQKIMMMPMETSGVIGAIAGIGELTKEAFNTKKGNS